ncbi:MAG: hypothetical protein ACFFA4_12575 [Promethearchaeota archaeon]
MRRKVDLNLYIGYLLLSIGLLSVVYSVITLVLSLLIWYTGITLYLKDILFELVFILLGFLVIRNRKMKIEKLC